MILLSAGTLARRVGDEADGVECNRGRGDGGGRGEARTSGEETMETNRSLRRTVVVCFYTGVVLRIVRTGVGMNDKRAVVHTMHKTNNKSSTIEVKDKNCF